ncbi:MAG: 5'-nucleotidase C-terminal domain-containing protein [Actinomycetota bacterium]
MPRRFRLSLALTFALVAALLPLSDGGAQVGPPKPSSEKVIMFSADGMRQDLVHEFVDDGAMPTHADLLAAGSEAAGPGMLQGFPPNTGVGWNTMSTGTWPGEFGITNNTFHRTGGNFAFGTSAFAPGLLQADTIAQAAEREGKTVVSVEWVGGRNLGLDGPVVDFRSFRSGRGVTTNFERPSDDPSFIQIFGLQYDLQELDRAKRGRFGWTNVPTSFSRALETTMRVLDFGTDKYGHNVYIYDSTDDDTTNYDHALLVRAPSKDGSQAAADLAEGEWADIKLTIESSTSDPLNGKTGGMYVKLEELSDDAEQFRIYHTSVTRVQASFAEDPTFEDTLAEDFPTSVAADFAPLEAGIVTEDTYVEQGLMWKDAHFAYLDHIFNTLGVEADLLMLGTPVTDEFSHQFMGLVTETDIDGDPNPFFDDVENDDVADGRVEAREGYIEAAYEEADATLGLGLSLMGEEDTTVFSMSDHGFAPQWLAVNGRRVLFDAEVEGTSLHESGENQVSNCRADSDDLTKACWAGGTIQVYVNPELPEDITYEEVRAAVVEAFQNLSDPDDASAQVVDEIFLKEELRDVDGSDSLHPNRSGDVVVALRPPYQSDAGTPGEQIAPSHFFGQHGYLPDLVDLEHNVNMRATFIAAGPGIRQGVDVEVRAIDVAPTAAFLMDIPGPHNARGRILYELLTDTEDLREVSVLHISDYHGQLTPLSERSDSFGPRFGIGGAAFLKPWFDVYRAEARDGSVTLTAGDAVGATPPISNFFGDTPTIELMNMMGFDLDGLGNHNFDRGQEYLREELIPLADFSYVSANIVDGSTNDTPPEWSKSRVFDFGGVRVGFIGFSNEDIPTLTKPGSLGPFIVTDALEAVNQVAEQLLRRQGGGTVSAIVALGHLGATTGSLTDPSGPLIELADDVSGVDVVIGDHTSFQVISTRPNDVLVTENLSKGVRFTRIRLVINAETQSVVYKTADLHKPWTIGVEPDPDIQARIDELNAELAPILGTVIGESTVEIPRSDSCGHAEGRTCESLVGNAVTDAMRATYEVDFAITNAGGLRASLTCPPEGDGDGFCPSFTPPPWKITRGQVLAVLPFGNVVSTVTVTGAELKAFLENAVSRMPAPDGRFAQVSGLCFTYDIGAAAGNRVSGAVRQGADGSCTGTAVSFDPSANYTLAINDFMASGGDGYPNVAARATTRDVMDQVVADYLSANTPISPAIQERIDCTGATCPTVTP